MKQVLFFPKFFMGSIEKVECCGKMVCGEFVKGQQVQNMQVQTNEDDYESEIGNTAESPLFSHKKIPTHFNFWRKFSKLTQKFPHNLIFLLLVIAIVIPFGLYSYKFTTTNSFSTYKFFFVYHFKNKKIIKIKKKKN